MDHLQIQQWETAVDQAELSILDQDLPEGQPAGSIYTHEGRKWMRVGVIRGNTGARWAYWMPWKVKDDNDRERIINGPGRHPEFLAVADKVFNGDAAHFIGMLAKPYVQLPGGKPTLMWVLLEPRPSGPTVIRMREEPVRERYERSKEVYDVNTGETTKLP